MGKFMDGVRKYIDFKKRKHKAEKRNFEGLTTYHYYDVSDEDLEKLEDILNQYRKEHGLPIKDYKEQ